MTVKQFKALVCGGFSCQMKIPDPIGEILTYFYIEFSGNEHDCFDVVFDIQDIAERTYENFDGYDSAIDGTEPKTLIRPLYIAKNQFDYITGFLREEMELESYTHFEH